MTPDASWTAEPVVIGAVLAAGGLYLARWRRARAEVTVHAPGAWRLASFVGGLLAILIALVSPVDRLAEQLFALHMVQHVLLLDVAPILLVLGLTKVLLRPATRRLQRLERAAGPLGHPVFAVALYCAVMWAWHVPAAYDGALDQPALHVLEHVTFASAGTLYWWHLLSPIRGRLRLGGLGPVAYMASTKLLVGLLGVAIAFAPGVLYPFYERLPRGWGLSAGDDQSIAGMVMALEQSLVMGVALAVLFMRMLGESEREEERAERLRAA